MIFEMEFDKNKINENDAYAKFCVNFVNQIRDKLNYKYIDGKFSIDLPVIRQKLKKDNVIRKDKPIWIDKAIPEKPKPKKVVI